MMETNLKMRLKRIKGDLHTPILSALLLLLLLLIYFQLVTTIGPSALNSYSRSRLLIKSNFYKISYKFTTICIMGKYKNFLVAFLTFP